MKKAAFAALLAIGLSVLVSRAQDSRWKPEVGRPFPAIALPSLEGGSPVDVSQFRGKKLLLHIFASW